MKSAWVKSVWKSPKASDISQQSQQDSSFVEEDIIASCANVWAKTHSLCFYINLRPPEPTLAYVCGLWATITSLTPLSWLYYNNPVCWGTDIKFTPLGGREAGRPDLFDVVKGQKNVVPLYLHLRGAVKKNKSIHTRAELIDHAAKQHVSRVCQGWVSLSRWTS